MRNKFIQYYLDVADRTAQLSSARRLKCGAILVKNDTIIGIGYNGMPSGDDNNCENVIDIITHNEYLKLSIIEKTDYFFNVNSQYYEKLKSKDLVIHAEANALNKLISSHESSIGSVMFITHNPCILCSVKMYMAGIKEVFYRNDYASNIGSGNTLGFEYLMSHNVNISKVL